VRTDICRVGFYVLFTAMTALLVLGVACLPASGVQGNQGPAISKVEAQYPNIYPRGYTDITCTASDSMGGELRYRWSSTGGTLIGEGATVRWEAPSSYGDYHIMVVAQDSAGRSNQGTVTVTVVLKPESACCGR